MTLEDRIPTNLRTLLILEIIGKSEEPLTATEINAQLGLPKQTVHRLCKTLEDAGFLTQQRDSRRFQASRRLRDLGAGLLTHSSLHIARRQILRDVARQTGETVNFAAPEDDGMSYVDRVETDWAFRIQLPIGTHVPFHCTASGKCFLASLTRKQRAAMLPALSLDRLTDRTHTTIAALAQDLDQIAERGYALDEQEFMDDMVAIAVPVRDASDRFVAALAFHGPTQRVSVADAVAQKALMQDAAQRISDVLFTQD